MKKITFLALAATVAMVSCTSKKSYQINGTVDSISELNGAMIYLGPDYETVLDSAVVKDGKFEFKGTASDTAQLLQLFTADRSGMEFILEAGVIEANFATRAISGTKLNDDLNAYKEKKNQFQESFMNYMKEMEADTTSGRTDEEKHALLQEKYDDVVKNLEDLSAQVFEKHPKDVIGTVAFMDFIGSNEPNLEKLAELRAIAGDIVLKDPSIVKMLEMTDNYANTAVGKKFVDFEGVDTESNEAVSLSKYVGAGNYALVDFWASWCGPCRGEIPHIANAYKLYKDKGLQVVGAVVWDKMDAHQKAKSELKVTWPQVFDNTEKGKELAAKYGIRGIPEVILFAPDGTVVARGLRGEEMLNKLAEVYAKK